MCAEIQSPQNFHKHKQCQRLPCQSANQMPEEVLWERRVQRVFACVKDRLMSRCPRVSESYHLNSHVWKDLEIGNLEPIPAYGTRECVIDRSDSKYRSHARIFRNAVGDSAHRQGKAHHTNRSDHDDEE